MSYPFFRILSISKTKISDEIGQDKAIVEIAPLKTLRAWEARANGIYAGSGLLVGKSDHLFPSSSLYPSSTTFPRNFIHLADNVLLYPSIDGAGWSKGYNTNIVYTQDGPDADSPTVATFNDASGDSSSYWYSYGNYAPQEAATTYVIALWVKVESGYTDIRCYTGDNTESSNYGSNARLYTAYERAYNYEGWKLLTWELTTSDPWYSDSLSIYIRGSWGTGKLSLSSPIMTEKNKIQFEIDNEELQQDDIYRINIYGVDNKDGEWSPRQLRKVRYIRDWISHSTGSNSHLWCEIEAYDKDGINVALGKTVTSEVGPPYAVRDPSYVTDGIRTTSNYFNAVVNTGFHYVEVDLGAVYELDKLWWLHYPNYRFYRVLTEVSVDGTNWETVYDSDIVGTFTETSAGMEIKL